MVPVEVNYVADFYDPMAAYRTFRGRDPEIGPLLARRFRSA